MKVYILGPGHIGAGLIAALLAAEASEVQGIRLVTCEPGGIIEPKPYHDDMLAVTAMQQHFEAAYDLESERLKLDTAKVFRDMRRTIEREWPGIGTRVPPPPRFSGYMKRTHRRRH